MGWDFASIANCRILLRLKREIIAIIIVKVSDKEARDFYTNQLNILIDSLHDFIEKK